jgi:hypothetical protein
LTSTILSAASGKKQQANMASKSSRTESDQPVIDMAEMGARIAARRAESKKALLKAIKDIGGNW